jgi:threonine dehydrogenase-like Zn-dependent dehydrogenase
MRALVWHGKSDIRCDTVPDPTIEEPGDMIVKITSTAICGSDLHLFDGYQPAMEEGDRQIGPSLKSVCEPAMCSALESRRLDTARLLIQLR